MMRRCAPLLLALALPVGVAAADDSTHGNAERGARLHAMHCVSCHDDGVYTRADRRVQSLDGLVRQVRACNRNLDAGLSSGEVDDLIAYLNQRYYRFD